jgi:UDP-glucose 4-epimerase
METVWVTGAKGFIGRHLCRFLAASGNIVYGVGHGVWDDADALSYGVLGWVDGAINNATLSKLLLETDKVPDRLYHLAGGSSVGAAMMAPYEDFTRTVVTTANLLEWLRKNATETKLVAVSSAAVYGAGHVDRISENTVHMPFSPYGFHKLAMEYLCQSHAQSFGQSVCIARLFSVYGPGLQKQLLWDICSQLARSPNVIRLGGTGDELRDWTFVDDIVQVLDRIAQEAASPAFVLNAGSGLGTTVRAIAEALIAAWGSNAALEFSGIFRAGNPQSLIADPHRLQAIGVNFHTGVHCGLAAYVDWYKKHTGISV